MKRKEVESRVGGTKSGGITKEAGPMRSASEAGGTEEAGPMGRRSGFGQKLDAGARTQDPGPASDQV